MLKERKLLAIIPFILLSLTACGGNNDSGSGEGGKVDPTPGPIEPEEKQDLCARDPVYSGADVNVSKIVKNNDEYNISVNDKDFLFLGTQIRVDAFMNCDKYTYADIKVLFKEAADLGVTCVQIPVEWSKIEIEKDVFDFEYVHEMLSYANAYNLKVELLWFGSNMCGDSHSYSVPNYILADGKTYPKFDALRTGEYWNYYGIMWFLDFENENLIARETNAISKMMEYVYWFDSTHGAKKPLIGVQIENEADIFPRWRIEQQSVLDPLTHEKMSEEEGFRKIYKLLDEVGKAVKASKYKVYTRTNLASSTSSQGIYSGSDVKSAPNFAKQMQALEGIDIVGDDCYTSSVKNVKGISYMYRESFEDNFSHIAENAGNYGNTPSLMLAALSQHGGYSIYDLVTSPFFIANGSNSTNQGIIGVGSDKQSFIRTSHYEDTKEMISGLKMVGEEIYKVSSDDFIAFNISGDYPKDSIEQNISSTNVSVNFQTSKKSSGFALDFVDHLDVFVTKDAQMTISNGSVSKVEKGSLADGVFNVKETLTASNTINLSGGNLYRITYVSSGKISSTTWNNIGA